MISFENPTLTWPFELMLNNLAVKGTSSFYCYSFGAGGFQDKTI